MERQHGSEATGEFLSKNGRRCTRRLGYATPARGAGSIRCEELGASSWLCFWRCEAGLQAPSALDGQAGQVSFGRERGPA